MRRHPFGFVRHAGLVSTGPFRIWRGAEILVLLLFTSRTLPAAELPPQVATQPKIEVDHATYLRDVLPILSGKCARCHNDQTQVMQSWLSYENASTKRWEI